MGTRSTIGILKNDGTIQSIYCQYDGYFSGNGLILGTHYRNTDKVKELISFGDMSSLGMFIAPDNGQEHNFNKRADNVCTFYTRDRGDDFSCNNLKTIEKYLEGDSFQEYNYLFKEKNQRWYFVDNKNKLMPLHSELRKLNDPDYQKIIEKEKEEKKIITEQKTLKKNIKTNSKKNESITKI